jgi:hypothetical protein
MEHNPPKGNFISSAVNPRRNQSGMERHVLAAETMAKLVAVVITSLGFFVWGQDIAGQYSDNYWVQLSTGLVFAGVAAWITDFAFSHFLENAMYQFINFFSFSWFGNIARDGIYITLFLKPLRWLVVTGIVAALFWADWNSVVTLRSPIANAKQEKAERVDWQQLDAAQAAAITAQLAPIDAELKTVRNRIAATEKKTAAANVGLQKLITDGNAWAATEMQRKKDRATNADRKRLEKLEAQRDQVYASATTSASSQRQLALADDTEAVATEQESKAAIATLFTMFGLGAKILTICFRLFLVINFLITKPGDVNGDGQINGEDVTAHARNSRNNTGTAGTTHNHAAPTGAPAFSAQENRIGFKHYDTSQPTPTGRTSFQMGDDVPPVSTLYTPVEQRSTGFQPQPGQNTALMVVDVKEWAKRCRQCYIRSQTSETPEAKQDNHDRYCTFRQMLETVGVVVEKDDSGIMQYRMPAKFTITPGNERTLHELTARLDEINTRRKRSIV